MVLVDGELAWFVERGGRSLLSFTADPETHHAAAAALAELVTRQRVPALLVERVDGVPVLEARESAGGRGAGRRPVSPGRPAGCGCADA